MTAKSTLRRIPLLGPMALHASAGLRRLAFTGSSEYWERRYRHRGNSGGGSYDRLGDFKARVLNAFVEKHAVRNVIEFGCGDGNQLALARYPRYVGFDVSSTALSRCASRFAQDSTKSFFLYDPSTFSDNSRVFSADLVLSLDVIYHLVEDDVFETYMKHLVAASTRFVGIYSSDRNAPTIQPHVKHRSFTQWMASRAPSLRILERVQNPYVGEDPETQSFSTFVFYERT